MSDYIIIAGGLTNYADRYKIIKNIAKKYKNKYKYKNKKIIYVLGSLEYTLCDDYPNIVKNYQTICDQYGIILLNNNYIETNDYIFYGTTLWSNINLGISEEHLKKEQGIRSYESYNLHHESVNKLHLFLREYTNTHKKLVVISHHLPTFSLIDSNKYKDPTMYASRLEPLLDPVDYWICGHKKALTNYSKHFDYKVKFINGASPFIFAP